MNKFKYCLACIISLGMFAMASAHINPNMPPTSPQTNSAQEYQASLRADCAQATAQVDQAINNVRARLLNGGDVWWDGDDGKYIVPKVDPGLDEVSSIFAGAVWLGGYDPAGNLKVAAQTYGSANGNTDFWPGPLTDLGTVEADTCLRWDRFFKVTGENIRAHLRNWDAANAAGVDYDPDLIPLDVKGWPARGNEFFFEINGWELPFTSQGLGNFFDNNGNGDYEPQLGDYPIIDVRGCTDWEQGDIPQYPDEMFFWIYNDNGNIHTQSTNSIPIQMEVQVQAFAYATNDEINNMTFQRYKLINRAIEDIDSCYFAMWVDADLGCHEDDYVGCDTLRDLAYVYNEDAQDGTTGCTCTQGTNTYCEEIPIIGIDYFRGPRDEFGNELPMSSFTYYNNGGIGNPTPGTTDPGNAQEYYNYLSGSWLDGTPFTYGGEGYDLSNTNFIDYAFTEAPDLNGGWSMCEADLYFGDRRTIQASGPFKLEPGAVNELIIGAVWVPDLEYPCPDIRPLLFADDLAQALFDNCFDITDGPDAPDVCLIELDREIVFLLSNDTITSNNAFEQYSEIDLRAPEGVDDSVYVFEGYKIFQVAGSDVSIGQLDDPNVARIVYQSDIRNGVDRIFNWLPVANPDPNPNPIPTIWTPVEMVDGSDEGVRHTFSIKEDQFASGDKRLINHRKYYFIAIAYAYNNYEQYDPSTDIGQRYGYLEGRRNIGPNGDGSPYVAVPRMITTQNINTDYGDGAVITRLDGVGNGGGYLDISDETRNAILNGEFDGSITYKAGAGPIDIKVVNPIEVKDGDFELDIEDKDNDGALDNWTLTSLNDNIIYKSETSIDDLNEQLISDFGFSISIVQSPDVGDKVTDENGALGAELVYADPTKPQWFAALRDGAPYNFVKTESSGADTDLDPSEALSNIGAGYFVPYTLCDWRETNPGLTPAWDHGNSQIVRVQNPLSAVNNVDIVFTSNRDHWSKCVVVETANKFYYDAAFGIGVPTEGDVESFNLRAGNSLRKEAGSDGGPQYDDSETGMSWFPGYAIDVETGKRLNIFFGENSVYNGELFGVDVSELFNNGVATGRDMMWNPTSQQIVFNDPPSFYNAYFGGQHTIYVTRQEYDECAAIREALMGNDFAKVAAVKEVTWTAIPVLPEGSEMLSYGEGLIPNDLTVQLRVENPYAVQEGTGVNEGFPLYQFKLEGYQATELSGDEEIDSALDAIGVVPNPYYGYSAYETSQFTNIVKITNLPANCTVTIYSLDGKFIRQYNRNEQPPRTTGSNPPASFKQVTPAIEWDLKNNKGIPVASGTYLIHIDADGLGERVIKWFGVTRQFDPSGL